MKQSILILIMMTMMMTESKGRDYDAYECHGCFVTHT